MPQLIYTAARSEAKVNEETVDGLQAIDYRVVRNRHDVGAVGTNERVAVYYGLTMVVGRLRVVWLWDDRAPSECGTERGGRAFRCRDHCPRD